MDNVIKKRLKLGKILLMVGAGILLFLAIVGIINFIVNFARHGGGFVTFIINFISTIFSNFTILGAIYLAISFFIGKNKMVNKILSIVLIVVNALALLKEFLSIFEMLFVRITDSYYFTDFYYRNFIYNLTCSILILIPIILSSVGVFFCFNAFSKLKDSNTNNVCDAETNYNQQGQAIVNNNIIEKKILVNKNNLNYSFNSNLFSNLLDPNCNVPIQIQLENGEIAYGHQKFVCSLYGKIYCILTPIHLDPNSLNSIDDWQFCILQEDVETQTQNLVLLTSNKIKSDILSLYNSSHHNVDEQPITKEEPKRNIVRFLLVFFFGWIGSIIINNSNLKPQGWKSRTLSYFFFGFLTGGIYTLAASICNIAFDPNSRSNIGYFKE